MPRYRLILAYEGTHFRGWQRQEPTIEQSVLTGSDKFVDAALAPEDPSRVALRTVQAVVERAAREVTRQRVILKGASRTDSGVHARGQVAAFTCEDLEGSGWPVARGCETLTRALNGRLPEDVLVRRAELVPDSFDPISDCERKAYSYTFHNARSRPLFDRALVHHVWDPLDVDAMRRAAESLVGEHDFAAFAAAGHGRLSTVRTVHRLEVFSETAPDQPDEQARRVRLEIEGNGFLWNMVRIIGGTLLEVGRGRLAPDRVASVLASRDRTLAGPTLPPTGLCLEWIRYPDAATQGAAGVDSPLSPV